MNSTTDVQLNYVVGASSNWAVEDNGAAVTCVSNGAYTPDSWTWTDPNSTAVTSLATDTGSTSVLRLTDITRYESGDYTCTALYGDIGSHEHDTQLSIYYLTSEPEGVTVVFGDTFNLTCSTNQPANIIQWYKDGTPLSSTSNAATSTLVLSSATFNDTAEYTCGARWGSEGETISGTVEVTVRGFSQHPESVSVVNGTYATLTCTADGDSAPLLTWYRGATELDHSPTLSISSTAAGFSTISRLTVSSLTGNTTDYKCVARWPDDAIVTSSSASVPVLGVEEGPVMEVVGVVGHDAEMICIGSLGAVISWFHNGTNITTAVSSSRVSTLSLTDLEWSDSGLYGCVAHFPSHDWEVYSGAEPATLAVRGVTVSPVNLTITEEGSDVTLTCIATGPPVPTFAWYKDDVSLETTGDIIGGYRSELVMSGSSLTDTGSYYCQASYGENYGSHNSTLSSLVVRGVVEQPQKDLQAVYGRNATLTCVIRGEETAPLAITWSRDGGAATMVTMVTNVTTTDVQSVVVVEEVTEEGVFRCTGSFTGDYPGTVVSEQVTISILGFQTHPSNTTAVLGYSSTLTCTVNGSPSNLSWYHSNGTLLATNQTELELETAVVGDEGGYSCEAIYPATLTTLGGSVTSEVGMVTVSRITSHPVDVFVAAGSPAQMNCSTTEYLPPTFTWTPGPTITTNGNLSVASWSSVSLSDEGSYHCNATFSSSHTVTSNRATLYVRDITTRPSARSAVYNHSATLTCEVHGTGWDRTVWVDGDGSEVKVDNGTTDSRLVLNGMKEDGRFSCRAVYEDPSMVIESEFVNVTVVGFETVTDSVTVVSGQSATVTCSASGSPIITWVDEEETELTSSQYTMIDGSTSRLIVPSVDVNRTVYCNLSYPVISGLTEGGTLLSEGVEIVVNDITLHPTNRTVVKGYNTSLECTGNNSPSISWYKDGVEVAGSNTSILSLTGVTESGTFTCQLTWPQGSLLTRKVHVRVLDIILQPMTGITVTGGNSSASCSAPLSPSFTWYKDGVEVTSGDGIYTVTMDTTVTGGITTTHTLLSLVNASTSTDGSYICVASYNESGVIGGDVSSNPATLSVYRISGHPEDMFVLFGSDISLSCTMNSSVTATTWYHNDHPLSEEEGSDVTVSDVTSGTEVTSELTLSNTSWASAGYYYCQGVFDGVGNVTSTPANVFVRGLWESPADTTIVLGREAMFRCIARGDATITWLFDDVIHASSNATYSDSGSPLQHSIPEQ